MTTADEVVDALAKSVHQLDNARRVGWARSYEAENRSSDLEKELAVARGDNALLSNLAGILWGFVLETTDGRRGSALGKHVDIGKLTSFLGQAAINKGREAGGDYADLQNSLKDRAIAYAAESEQIMSDIKSGKRAMGEKLMRYARNAEYKHLMRKYGFDSAFDMNQWLARYATRNEPPSGD